MADKRPVLGRSQIVPGEGPELYVPLASPELLPVWGQFFWEHQDLCLFHQAIYAQVGKREDRISEILKTNPEVLHFDTERNVEDDLGAEVEAVRRARIRESIRARDMETEGIQNFGDQLLVIGFWAIVEKYCGRTLILTEHSMKQRLGSHTSPHQWDQLEKRFLELGVRLHECKSYTGVNECRVLNNKIKHVGVVDSQLASFDHFRAYSGQPIEMAPLPLQFYADSVFEFVGCVMEGAADLAGV